MNIPVLIDMANADINTPLKSMADRLSAAGQTLVVGMLAVFSVLAILWLVLAFMGRWFETAPKKETAEEAKSAATPIAAPAPTAVPVQLQEDEAEIVAAITAAISVTLGKPQSAFRVVSFKQTSREAFRRNNINKN
ncbi:MAG: hypothetical protein E7626_06985 [Ruminococcaceae bacterium]|nr:hypothetical protein [Oscillospiraceae bacterium]